MNDALLSSPPTLRRSRSAMRSGSVRRCGASLAALALAATLSGQTVITIFNPSFESPVRSAFADYSVGATDWTRTRSDIDAGTFSPGFSGTTPNPIDGTQVGYVNGSGGLQQVLGDTFTANRIYTFSASVGYRSDTLESSDHGTGTVSIGYLDSGTFVSLASQSATVFRADFDLVTGAYQSTVDVLGRPIVLQLTNPDSFQVLFDQVQLSASPVPEPSMIALGFGTAALVGAWVLRRRLRASTANSP